MAPATLVRSASLALLIAACDTPAPPAARTPAPAPTALPTPAPASPPTADEPPPPPPSVGTGTGVSIGLGHGAPIPVVHADEPTVGPDTGLPVAVVRRIVRAHLGQVRFCHSQGLALEPALAGRVDLRFVVAGDGHVASSDVAASTLGDTDAAHAVERCLVEAVRDWTFPEPTGNADITVTYPFVLAPLSDEGGMGLGQIGTSGS